MKKEVQRMKRSIIGIVGILLLTALMSSAQQTTAQGNLPLNTIKLPTGFKITVYASGLPDARSMTLGDDGTTLFVGSRQAGKVYAVSANKQIHVIASGLDQP